MGDAALCRSLEWCRADRPCRTRKQIALAARESGMEVVYQGIRRTPAQIAATERDEDVDLIGLSVLSGSHVELIPAVVAQLAAVGVNGPIIVGGIIPAEDHDVLRAAGVDLHPT